MGAAMNPLCDGALSFLEQVYAEDSALFPFTTRVVDDGYRSVFDHPMTIRSTINCLVGLQEAARHAPDHEFLHRTPAYIERFVRLHEDRVALAADVGLLLLLLATQPAEHSPTTREATARTIARAQALVAAGDPVRPIDVQDVCWLLWGSVAAARRGLGGAEPLARDWYRALVRHFVPSGAVLPSHTASHGRFGVVSFGSCTYFLRSVHDYAAWSHDAGAERLFRQGLNAMLTAQGPQGEWPWMLANSDARPLDMYPVFTVHQLSMAMLFLFPGAACGAGDLGPVIARSIAWCAGENQLGRRMLQDHPFLIYRSLERKALVPRAERFARALLVSASGRRAHQASSHRLAVNHESRSYEMGWLLYALSARERLPGFDADG
jgi:hypothetical protein